jgi:hypothetical protein
MAKWSLNVPAFTPAVGTSDAVVIGGTTGSGFVGLLGGSTTQYVQVYEMEEQGLATTAGGANIMIWARASTLTASASTLASPNAIGPLDPNTGIASSPTVGIVAGASGPYRSASAALGKLNMAFNSFGGILRWQAAPGCEWGILGNTAPSGESDLTPFGTAAIPGIQGNQTFKVLFEIM